MDNLIKTYAQYPITLVKGAGARVWDDQGKEYLDFYGGHAVCLLGHCPPAVVKAIKDQSDELIFYSNIFKTKPAKKLAELLCGTLLPNEYQAYFANSGSEANETALKIARKFTGKKHLISFKNSFHGRSFYPLAVTGIDHYHEFDPNFDAYTTFAELGDLDSVKKAYTPDTAAVICEPIQSIGGINMAEPSFYAALAEFCREKNILLIFDEVQTGLGRSGEFWLSKSMGIHPDIITTAKGLASGLPISAVLVKKAVSSTIKVGEHATTFGGGPLVCAAAVATVEEILSNGFLAEVSKKSAYLREGLSKLPAVTGVKGRGFLVGVVIPGRAAKDLVKRALEAGVLLGSSNDGAVFRLMPPINVSRAEIDEFINRFSALLI